MITLSINTDFSSVAKILDRIDKAVEARAIPPALNKVAEGARTEMTRAITSEYAISSADVRAKLKINRASRRLGIYEATLDPFAGGRNRKSMNLIRFLEKKVTIAEMRRRLKGGTLRQLRFKIRRDHGLQTVSGSFIQNKGRTVFRRTGKSRYPIEAVQTRGVVGMFNTQRISVRVLSRIERDLPVQMVRAINAVLVGRIS